MVDYVINYLKLNNKTGKEGEFKSYPKTDSSLINMLVKNKIL